MVKQDTFEARLVSAKMLSPYVRELVFERVDGLPVTFVAGQWVNLVLQTEQGELRRAYSIASPPKGDHRFELAVTRVEGGPGSMRLHSMEVGDAITTVAPQGFFIRKHDAPSLFVGTGTGVTPLRSMLTDALAKKTSHPTWLLFGVRNRDDMLYRDEWVALEKSHPSIFRSTFTLSRDSDCPETRQGYVQAHVRELYDAMKDSSTEAPHVYICGLQKMVSAVRDLLRKDMGLPRELVHSERYD